MKNCATCSWELLAQPLSIKAKGNELLVEIASGQSTNKTKTASSLEVSGACTFEASPNGRRPLDYPLEISARDARLLLNITMPLEEYVAAALAGEVGGVTSAEALKAMAVAARTYAARFRAKHQAEGFDFCDTTHCQDLRLAADERIREAVAATEGELLWYRGEPIEAYYHRHCGGVTEAADTLWPLPGRSRPYLRQITDTFCVARGRGEWNSEIAKSDLAAALVAADILQQPQLKSVTVIARTPSGRALRVRLSGSQDIVVPAEAFRFAVGRALGWEKIRSDLYEARDVGDRIIFNGRGAGHGVGLCQEGAIQMAADGRDYREILAHYYPGTSLGLTAQGLAWSVAAGERIELQSTRLQNDRWVIGAAERVARDAEARAGWELLPMKPGAALRARIRVYPSVAVFRNATGAPGYVAAVTRGSLVRMQPPEILQSAGAFERTLRHEFLHMLVEQRAKRALPLWFREGIVLALEGSATLGQQDESSHARNAGAASPFASDASLERALREPRDEQELQRAYRAARSRVEELIRKYGKDTVLGWLERGLPPNL